MRNKTIYFLGIGGIGMSALAQYFLQRGDTVSGYDLTPSAVTDMLLCKGAYIHFEGDVTKIPEKVDFVVVTPAVPKDFVEYQYLVDKGVPMYKRSQVLGHITDELRTLAVAGTHGNTTTTSMIAHLLYPEQPLAAFIGGISKNLNDNYICSHNPDTAVVEADEFDRSFLTLHPEVGVITSMDADHLDIYGEKEKLVESFQLYASQVRGAVVVHEKIADQIQHPHKVVYGMESSCDYFATDIQLCPNTSDFVLHHGDEVYPVHLSVSGTYNVLNAVAAFAAVNEYAKGRHNQQEQELWAKKLAGFNGVKRRFDYRIERPDFVYIDDYAHHPEELRAFITAVGKIYAGKHICGIFQPHLYSRTRDFAPQFAEVLSILDTVILLDIYPARELPIPGITSQYLLNMIQNDHKYLLTTEEVIPFIERHKPDVLLTMGAGNIDRLVPRIEGAFSGI